MESDESDPAFEYTSDDSIDDEVEILDNRYEASDDVIDGDDNSEEWYMPQIVMDLYFIYVRTTT